MANNRLEVITVIRIFLKVKPGSDRASKRLRNRERHPISKVGSSISLRKIGGLLNS